MIALPDFPKTKEKLQKLLDEKNDRVRFEVCGDTCTLIGKTRIHPYDVFNGVTYVVYDDQGVMVESFKDFDDLYNWVFPGEGP